MRKLAISPSLLRGDPHSTIRLFQDIMNDRRVNLGDPFPLTIASNAITIPASISFFSVDGGGASTDLKTIVGGVGGDFIVLYPINSAHDIVLKNGTGNILCDGAADITLSSSDQFAICVFDGTNWKVASLGGGGGAGLGNFSQISGQYYTSPFVVPSNGISPIANTMYAMAVFFPESVTLTKLSVYCVAAQAAKSVRLGVYSVSAGLPGSLILDAGVVSLATTGIKEITGLSLAVAAGTWLFFTALSNASSATVLSTSGTSIESWMFGTSDPSISPQSGFTVAQTYGALPSTFGTAVPHNIVPAVWYRF